MARARNSFMFNGKRGWSGSVSTIDGNIEEIHTAGEAEEMDFHHSMYFSSAAVERIDDGESAFFWMDGDEIFVNWRDHYEDEKSMWLIARIKEQIKPIKWKEKFEECSRTEN